MRVTKNKKNKHEGIEKNKKSINAMARRCGLVQRTSSRLTGSDVASILAKISSIDRAVTLQEMTEMLKERRPQVKITPQGIQQRINMSRVLKCHGSGFRGERISEYTITTNNNRFIIIIFKLCTNTPTSRWCCPFYCHITRLC